MIKLRDGRVADLLQNESEYNAEIQALSFAILQEKRRIMELAAGTRTISMIDELPEDILDVLAVELRTPYYSGDLSLERKRDIIKKTLRWFFKAGTPAALEEFIAAVFGEGYIVEWPEFTEPPYTPGTFDIVTDVRMTEDIVEQFLQLIRRVKNTRSHLRRVLTERHGELPEWVGSGSISYPEVPVLNNMEPRTASDHGDAKAKAGTISRPEVPVLNNPEPRTASAKAQPTAKSAVTAAPEVTIVNEAPAKQRTASGPAHIGAVLVVSDIHRVIQNSPPPGAIQIGQKQTAAAAAATSSNITIEGG